MFKTPSPSSIDNNKPSQAEPSLVTSPSKLSNLISAILLAAPSACLYASVNSSILSVCSAKTLNDEPPIPPANFCAVRNFSCELFTLSTASLNSIPLFFNSTNIAFKAVPPLPPFIALLAKTPSIAVVSSNDFPVPFAAGETFFKDSTNSLNPNALVDELKANTSTT